MNPGCNLIASPFNTSQARFKEFGDVSLSGTIKVYKVFTKVGWGPGLKRKLCLGPTGVINCTSLSTLSFWMSFFPGAFGYNILASSPLNTPRLKTCLSSWQPPTSWDSCCKSIMDSRWDRASSLDFSIHNQGTTIKYAPRGVCHASQSTGLCL